MSDANGALDLRDCPTASYFGRCRCGKCLNCEFQKHMAIHGPYFGKLPGTKPWGHKFIMRIEWPQR